LNRLRELELSDNELGDEGAIALSESSLLGKLVELDLSSNHITRVGARALAERAGKRLRSFWLLRGNDVPAMFVQTMKSHGVGVV
jgi:Leucine-rich repeat (LRR) protein